MKTTDHFRILCQATEWAFKDEQTLLAYLAVSQIRVELAASRAAKPSASGSVAIIPVHGPITQRSSIWHELFGGASTDSIGAAFSRAVNNTKVSGIVLDIDSPGGTSAGVEQLSDMIYNARGYKPIVAIADSQAASAAYWVGSSADKFYSVPGGDVGSIGVFRMHQDWSEYMKNEGVKTTFLARPEYKVEANPLEPLTADGAIHHMSQVEATYGRFRAAVARNRGRTEQQVENDYGRGRTYHAEQAAGMGLVDGVRTLADILGAMPGSLPPQIVDATSQAIAAELCAAWDGGLAEMIRTVPNVWERRLKLKAKQT